MKEEFIAKIPEETMQIAGKLSKKLNPGDIICLYGDLGSGKTTFIQGLASALDIRKRVISPTFIIVRQYKLNNLFEEVGVKNFYHLDLYRVETKKDLESVGVDEILNNKEAIVAIEWPERLGESMPKNYWQVNLGYMNKGGRRITIEEVKNI